MRIFVSLAILLALPAAATADEASNAMLSRLLAGYSVTPNVTYLKADNVDLKLDIYAPSANLDGKQGNRKPIPTVIIIHGGGWVGGSKEMSALRVLPYLFKGWAAVNVEYRLAGAALAPAAVEDVRCAAWWVKRNAEKYGFDPDRIVLTGASAGGHLALIAGMLPASAGLDTRCPATKNPPAPAAITETAEFPELKVAAIVNWAGITDVADLIAGPNIKTYAVTWLGSMEQREAVAKRVSPLTYVRKWLPPIITLHGDQDGVVPYTHAIRLHQALEKSGVPNVLYPVKGGHHLDFSAEEMRQAYAAIDAFLAQYVGE